ncbi:hypothetical protein GGR57DRAFT_504923 [Xylariaceae sp. FL1272]|nr:hypothetical protein GGR57DRAFT_504923 [Xylariaceae sp. FL1272]
MSSTVSLPNEDRPSSNCLEARNREVASQLQTYRAQLIREECPLQVCQIQEKIGDLQYEFDDIQLLLANEAARKKLKVDHLAAKASLQARNHDAVVSALQSQNKALRDEVNSLKEGLRTSETVEQFPRRSHVSDLTIKKDESRETIDLTAQRVCSVSPNVQSDPYLRTPRNIPPLPQSIFRSSSLKASESNMTRKGAGASDRGPMDGSKRRRTSAHVANEITTGSAGISKHEHDKDCQNRICGVPFKEKLEDIKNECTIPASHPKITRRKFDMVAYSRDVIEVKRSVSPELGYYQDR